MIEGHGKSQKSESCGTIEQRQGPDLTYRALLANLLHELRTPLNVIIGYSEILLEDAKDQGRDDLMPDFDKIHSACGQLLSLLNDILDQAKIKKGKIDTNIESFGIKLRHELRTPLNAIIGYSEMLLEDEEGEEHSDFIEDLKNILVAAKRFLLLINDIVNWSSLEPGKNNMRFEAIDTTSMIEDVESTIRPLIEDHSTKKPEKGALLVVDDNEMNRDLMARHLTRQGHKVIVAENGVQALDNLKIRHFDLVLLDIIMPEMNGYELLKHMKSDVNLRNIPIIMITALEELESVVRCIEMGAEDYLPKHFNPVLLKARINACLEKKRLRDQEVEFQRRLSELNKELEIRNRFIRATFGRYISEEVVDNILETPEGLELGGKRRKVTILMADLRGFTSFSEGLSPEDVVNTINIFFETMTEIIFKYQGTIDEFLGDAILAVFGAPVLRHNDAMKAVACAVEMQLAMSCVNDRLRKEGKPEVKMGIGINTGSVVAGNIGSKKRTKYGVVGQSVNVASRIESLSVGGQILISESTLNCCGSILRIDDHIEIVTKGLKSPIKVFEIGGIAGDFNQFLPAKSEIELYKLKQPLSVRYAILKGKKVGKELHNGIMDKLSADSAEIRSEHTPDCMTNLKILIFTGEGNRIINNLYAKVFEILPGSPPRFRVRFTSVPINVNSFIKKILIQTDVLGINVEGN